MLINILFLLKMRWRKLTFSISIRSCFFKSFNEILQILVTFKGICFLESFLRERYHYLYCCIVFSNLPPLVHNDIHNAAHLLVMWILLKKFCPFCCKSLGCEVLTHACDCTHTHTRIHTHTHTVLYTSEL